MAGNIIELHTEVPAELEANVFGQFDEHLKLIERTLNVTESLRYLAMNRMRLLRRN